MKRFFSGLIISFLISSFLLFLTPLVRAQTNGPIIADHLAVGNADLLTDQEVAAAAALKMLVRHASVGENIKVGLESLASQYSRYDRDNWVFQNRGNPSWEEKVDDLVRETVKQFNNFNIFTMKFCYIDQDADWAYYRDHMNQLESSYPNKIFIWWTMPIMTDGNSDRDDFNASVRAYCQANNKILFDIAAIESHNPNGTQCTSSGEALCQSYTSDGGHLNDLNGTGGLRVAKALWWLVAQIAKGGGPTSTPRPTLSPTPTPSGYMPECFGTDSIINPDDLLAWGRFYSLTTDIDTNFDNKINAFEVGYLIKYWGKICIHTF